REIEDKYGEIFSLSKVKHNNFVKYLPNGCARSLSYYDPFPLHIERGEGAYIYTIEGNRLLDLTNGYSALIHGHCHPEVNKAIIKSLQNGILFSTPSEILGKFTELLSRRVPSMEKMLICNSGTEATLFALRTARAVSKKNKILKIYGGYHGLHDCVAISPRDQAIDAGVTEGMVQDIIEVDFNDFESFEKAISIHFEDLAAVIIEPFLGAGGIVPPKEGYLEFVREITRKQNIILIFDEILTFRIHEHGAQGYYNLQPDMTTVGKIVGGGFPIGVFGGKASIMNIYDKKTSEKPLYFSGTFNGYETAMYAGCAALMLYDATSINRLNLLGEYLYNKIKKIISKLNLSMQVTRCGSILQVHFVNEEITSYEIVLKAEQELLHFFHLSLLMRKYYVTPRGMIVLSTPMTENEIGAFAEAIEEVLVDLFPLIQEKYSHLISAGN
ncbi:MAG: aspartate aminotransferase family protein, partial [Flavobacteriales bacterium]|nr:aspartate aminotransferase family protein [Flavobacteriales bacterium]